MRLPGFQVRYLRSLANSLEPVIRIGKDNIQDDVIEACSNALDDHELIKVKLLQNAAVDRKEAAQELENRLDCCVVNIVGKTIILYRQSRIAENIKICLPSSK